MQEAFPKPLTITLRHVADQGRFWVVEGVNDYGDEVWHVVVWELDEDGRIVPDTRYYGQKFDAPQWRRQWVELVARLATLPWEFAVRRAHRGTAPASSYWMYGGAGAVPRGVLLSVDSPPTLRVAPLA